MSRAAARRPRARSGVASALAALLLVACGDDHAPAPRSARAGGAGMRFEEAAEAAGLRFRSSFLPREQGAAFRMNLYDHGAGLAVGDVDGDGDDDVYFCNQLGPNALFLNDGAGRFTDVTARAGVALPDVISVAAVFGDMDGDDDVDLYVTTTRGGNVYFRNRGDGTFEDATATAGLALVAHAQQPTLFDADGDGDLDLLVMATARWTTEAFDSGTRYWQGPETILEMMRSPVEYNHFYRNRGDGTFEYATGEARLAGPGWGSDAAVFDYDEDGDLDVFVARMFGRSTLFANDGKGHFTDVTAATLGRTSAGAVGAKVFDLDGDGRLDLFTSDMHSDMWMGYDYDPRSEPEGVKTLRFAQTPGTVSEQNRLLPEEVLFGNTLHRNLGRGKFVELSDAAGVETLWPWGIAAGDFDADGFEDLYLPSGMGFPFAYWRSPMLRNRGDSTFEEVSAAAGLEPLPGGPFAAEPIGGRPAAKSLRAAATADFDGDGRLDLVVTSFNDRALLFMNRSPARPWIGLRLVGPPGRRAAIGAVARVRVGPRTFVRMVQAAGGYLAQSSNTLHVGLGPAAGTPRVEVRWPDGVVQDVGALAPGRVHVVEHPQARARR
ncbi:MAG: CRTAC1 family protein [Planctomycetota bacterium]